MFMDDATESNPLTSQHTQNQHHHHDQDEAEESLSFSDLPLDKEKSDEHTLESFRKNPRRSSSEPLDLFEFFTTGFITSEISPAEDLIFCGRLLPLNDHSPLTSRTTSENNFWKLEESRKQTGFRKRSESLSGLQSSVSRSNSAKINLKRNSRSLDYRRLYRQANSIFSPTAEIDRNCSIKSGLKPDPLNKKASSKPRWYLLMFGMVKFPAEMDLSDIKSRQVRRSSSALFPANENKGKFQCNRNSGEAAWRILRALSCKNHASVDVTASLTAWITYHVDCRWLAVAFGTILPSWCWEIPVAREGQFGNLKLEWNEKCGYASRGREGSVQWRSVADDGAVSLKSFPFLILILILFCLFWFERMVWLVGDIGMNENHGNLDYDIWNHIYIYYNSVIYSFSQILNQYFSPTILAFLNKCTSPRKRSNTSHGFSLFIILLICRWI